jgi:hypothetical protein
MQKDELHEGGAYAYRENLQRWKRGEDRPVRVSLIRYIGGGRVEVRHEEGPQTGQTMETKARTSWRTGPTRTSTPCSKPRSASVRIIGSSPWISLSLRVTLSWSGSS